ncbi:MAG: glucosaminidase domain-containing protein, partial [Culicoidibacterales bacterium]
NYFYTNPETIGPDMNDGVANSAINANDPYYNYFQNLPFNSKAVATAAQLDAYINANTQATSKLRNTGQAFIDAQNKYGINALLMLGIAINESNWGMSSIAQSKNNLFGLNAVDATPGESADYFPTVAACIDLYASDWLAQGYADPQDWRYYGGMLGNKSMGANVKYASDAYWSEKAVAHMYTVDRGINGGTSKEWNYYSLGWFTAPNSVKSSNGQVIYPITAPDSNGVLSLYSSYTNTPIILKETNASDGKYEVWPARNNTLSSSNNVPTALPYNWNGGEYISTSGVNIITEIKPMQPVYSFDHVKISNKGNLEFYGWMISKNMNITNPNDMKIEFVLSNNGDQVLATASRWERHDVTPIYGGGKYQYPWAGMRLNVDLGSLPVGTYGYHLRLSQPGYTAYGQVIPGTTTKIINGKKITISGSTIKVESAPIQTMQPVYSFDHVKIDTRGNLEFYGWMISKNMDLETASDMKIEFVLSNNGDQVLATAARWQRY